MADIFIGLGRGQKRDYTAVAVVEHNQADQPFYDRHGRADPPGPSCPNGNYCAGYRGIRGQIAFDIIYGVLGQAGPGSAIGSGQNASLPPPNSVPAGFGGLKEYIRVGGPVVATETSYQ